MITPEALKTRLLEHFSEALVEVTDLTGTQDHYQVLIVTPDFEGMRLLKRQRSVNAVFSEELANGTIHAFAMNTWTPEEHRAKSS